VTSDPAELPTDWWTATDVAKYLGVAASTVRSMLAQQLMPKPGKRYGRTNLWRPRTIQKWNASRPRKGRETTETPKQPTGGRP
jgi:hypothetical protein